MQGFSSSKKLIQSVRNFLDIKPINLAFYYFFYKKYLKKETKQKLQFYGWGRKKSGFEALRLAKKYGGEAVLLEDGFIRSLGLGLENSPSFSLVFDRLGIYYDSTSTSTLEHILNTYDFKNDTLLMQKALEAKNLLLKYELSKYNTHVDLPKDYFSPLKERQKRILIITQTLNDASLFYGQAQISTETMIKDALKDNENAQVYIKIHPDVLSGKKRSDFDFVALPQNCFIIKENFSPLALLKHFDKVYTKTSQMGFEALLSGCECLCYGLPFYAGWGLTSDRLKCERRKRRLELDELFAGAYLLYTRYFNPYLEAKSDIIDTLHTLNKYKKINEINTGRLFFLGFNLWKRGFVKPFFEGKNKLYFLNSLKLHPKFEPNDKLFVWGASFSDVEIQKVFGKGVRIFRVEDGFVRSLSLGSDLTRPYSLVVDSKGQFIDPSKPSDLEELLQNHDFSEAELQRAKKARLELIRHKFSKYNSQEHKKLAFASKKGQIRILIAAQVEDDASMKLGGFNLSTKELLKRIRAENQEAYIIFKTHPDVLSGNRKGLKDRDFILKYCDELVENVSIHSCLDGVDEVHTITSTVGFEALLRQKKVVVYGLPFYAGWGLTSDKLKCERRKRKLELDELVAGTLLLYPRYIKADSKKLCEFEPCFESLLKLQKRYEKNKHLQFLLFIRIFLLRKIRRVYESLI